MPFIIMIIIAAALIHNRMKAEDLPSDHKVEEVSKE